MFSSAFSCRRSWSNHRSTHPAPPASPVFRHPTRGDHPPPQVAPWKDGRNERARGWECWKRQERSVMPTSCGKLVQQRLTLTCPTHPQPSDSSEFITVGPARRFSWKTEARNRKINPTRRRTSGSVHTFFGRTANANANGVASLSISVCFWREVLVCCVIIKATIKNSLISPWGGPAGTGAALQGVPRQHVSTRRSTVHRAFSGGRHYPGTVRRAWKEPFPSRSAFPPPSR